MTGASFGRRRGRGVLRLVLEDCPHPGHARALSPNGRAHWVQKRKARLCIEFAVHQAVIYGRPGIAVSGLQGPVRLRAVFVVPQHRRRDDDNYATGVLKVVRDALVRLGVIEADDMGHLRQEPVQVEVLKGQRRLIVELAEMGAAAGAPEEAG